jgi:UDP-2,3-diacylglucosamine hydrolase
LANFWSGRSRKVKSKDKPEYLGDDKEWLVIFSKEQLEKEHYDYFIYGHRHTPIIVDLPNKSHYVNLGDWINHFSYGVFDGENFEMKNHK